MSRRRLFSVLLTILTVGFLTACAAAYTPKEIDGKIRYNGLRESELEPGIHRIILIVPARGRGSKARQEGNRKAAEMIFLFAAELALEKGYPEFVLLKSARGLGRTGKEGVIRENIANGHLDEEFIRSINMRIYGHCTGAACTAKRQALVIVAMFKAGEAKFFETFNAREVVAKLKPKLVSQSP